MQTKTLKQRLAEFLAHLKIGQAKFAENVGLSKGFANNVGDSIRSDNLEKIAAAYPELDLIWLQTGRGEMLKAGVNVTHGKNSHVVTGSATSGGVVAGAVNGAVTVNHNGGKDMVIDEQKKEVEKMFEAIIVAVNGFQQSSKRHDEYIVGQDDYIKSQAKRLDEIVKHAYLRNERNMERIDRAIEQQNTVIAQQNKVIEMVIDQNKRTQDRADRLLDLLEKKM